MILRRLTDNDTGKKKTKTRKKKYGLVKKNKKNDLVKKEKKEELWPG